jgi:hypothetical protein
MAFSATLRKSPKQMWPKNGGTKKETIQSSPLPLYPPMAESFSLLIN